MRLATWQAYVPLSTSRLTSATRTRSGSGATGKTSPWVATIPRQWGHGALWSIGDGEQPHEAHYLKLDISKAGMRLGWQPRWSLETALARAVDWHRSWLQRADVRSVCLQQIDQYNTALNE